MTGVVQERNQPQGTKVAAKGVATKKGRRGGEIRRRQKWTRILDLNHIPGPMAAQLGGEQGAEVTTQEI